LLHATQRSSLVGQIGVLLSTLQSARDSWDTSVWKFSDMQGLLYELAMQRLLYESAMPRDASTRVHDNSDAALREMVHPGLASFYVAVIAGNRQYEIQRFGGDAACEFENVSALWTCVGDRFLRAPSSYTMCDPMFLRGWGNIRATPVDASKPMRARFIFLPHRARMAVYYPTFNLHQYVFHERDALWLLCIARLLVLCKHTDTHIHILLLHHAHQHAISARAGEDRSEYIGFHYLTLGRIVLAAREPCCTAGWSRRQFVEYVAECQRQLGFECVMRAKGKDYLILSSGSVVLGD